MSVVAAGWWCEQGGCLLASYKKNAVIGWG